MKPRNPKTWKVGMEIKDTSIHSPWYIERIEIKHQQKNWDINIYQIAHLRSKKEPNRRTQWSTRL